MSLRKIWEILANEVFVAYHIQSLLAGIYSVVELQRFIFLEFAFGMEDVALHQGHGADPLAAFRL